MTTDNRTIRFLYGARHLAAVIATTILAVAVSIYSVNHGLFIAFQNFFYFPIIIACIYYLKRGFVFSVGLALLYFFLLSSYTTDTVLIHEALVRAVIFILIAAVVTFIALRRRRAQERLETSKDFTEKIFNSISDPLFVIDTGNFKIVEANEAFRNTYGQEVIGKRCYELTHKKTTPCAPPDHPCPLEETLQTGKPSHARHIHYCLDGIKRYSDISVVPVRNKQGEIYQVVHLERDVTEHVKEQQRLDKKVALKNFLIDLYKEAPVLADSELYDRVLEQAVRLSDSTAGFFHFVSDDQITITLTAWNNEALKNRPASYVTHYPIDQAGKWGDCVRLKRPVVYNDFSDSPDQKGVPDGHVPLYRLMSVPVMEGDKVRMIFGVGNKAEDYDEHDVLLVQLLANDLQRIIGQRRAEEALSANEKKYRTFFQTSRDCVFITSREGKWIDFNDAAVQLFGFNSREDLKKVNILDLYQNTQDRKNYTQTIIRQGYSQDYALDLRKKDGSIIRTLITSVPLKDENGEITGYQGTIKDITDKRRAEEELAWETAFLEAQVEATIDGILVVDNNGKKILVNQHLFDIFKIPQYIRDDNDDMSLFQYSTGLTKDREAVAARIRYLYDHPNETSQDEIELKDGMVLDRYSSPVMGKDGKYYGRIWTFRDITERRKIQSELQKKNLELAETCKELKKKQATIIQQEKMASIGVLTAGIAHEIKNPLSIILQGINYLQSTVTGDVLMAEVIERLNQAIIRADKIIKGLVSYSRQNPLNLTEQDIPVLIDESLALIEHELHKKNLRLIKQYAPGLPKVAVDGNQIKQVFINVLLNGIDAMSPKGVFTIGVRQIEDDTGKKALQISFKDTGVGIPADKIKNIFDPFYTTKSIGNTGLGLSVSKGIIDSHGGIIYAESGNEQGANIIIELPIP